MKFKYFSSINILYLFNLPSSFISVPTKTVLAGTGTKVLMQARFYYPLQQDTRVKEHDFSDPGPGQFSVR